MPDRLFPLGDNPTLSHRFLANPLTVGFALWVTLIGLVFIYEGVLPGRNTASSISEFPVWVNLIIGAGFIFGGPALTWSIFSRTKRIDLCWQWRKVAYTAIMLGGGAYAYYVVDRAPLDLLAFSLGMIHVTLGGFGLVSVVAVEWYTRKTMTDQGYDA